MKKTSETRLPWLIPGVALALVLLTFCAFFGVWRNEFVDYDDNSYVFLNQGIRQGLGWNTAVWAFTFVTIGHWIPLTWLSLALDYELYGLNAAGFHITNLILHAATVVVLFLAFQQATGKIWRSAAVAALFAVHPLRVESVAWVTERKDVLSGFFFVLTLLSYFHYTRGATSGASKTRAQKIAYSLALVTCALGLMSKSILVTVPFVLLLLDYWPLQRFGAPGIGTVSTDTALRDVWKLILEKWPFFALSAISCLITVATQQQEVTSNSALRIPLGPRLANTLLAMTVYVRQTVWPTGLSIFYPPQVVGVFAFRTLAVLALLGAVTVLVVLLHRRFRFLIVGWLWFLIVLAPVSGIVQVGDMIQADRYTYLSSIGLCLAAVWGVATLIERNPRLAWIGAIGTVGVVVVLAAMTQQQTAVWRNTRTLFTHAASVTKSNHVALTIIAGLDLKEGRIDEAITNLNRVLEFAPKYPNAEYHLGEALQMQGKMVESIPHLEAAYGPEVGIPSRARLVLSLIDAGRLTDADAALESLLAAIPGQPDLLVMKAGLLNEQGRSKEAADLFRSVLIAQPPALADNPRLNLEIAELYGLVGDNRKAVPFFEKTLEVWSQSPNALNDYAWVLATDPDAQVRNGAKAVELAKRACEAAGWKQPLLIGTLAAAYAEAGQFEEAIKMGERARDLAREQGQEDVARRNEELVKGYRERKPHRE